MPNPVTTGTGRPRGDSPHGVITHHRLASICLANEREVCVYLPPGYTADSAPYDVAILLEDDLWGTQASLVATLDRLINVGTIQPLIMLMPAAGDEQQRRMELGGNALFLAFLTLELLPWARAQWAITTAAERTLIAGQGLSGVTAAFAALAAPERFGQVLAQSIALWWSPDHHTCATNFDPARTWLTTVFQREAPMPVAFYIEAGGAEGLVTVANRRLCDLLNTKGYTLTYHEVNGVSELADWLCGLVRGLTALGVDPEPLVTTGAPPPLTLDAQWFLR